MMQHRIRGLFKSKEEVAPGLLLQQDEDRYWNVVHARTRKTLVTVSAREKAVAAAEELSRRCDFTARAAGGFDWDKAMEVAERHTESKVYNGAYRESIQADRSVTYRLQKMGWVKGEYVQSGLAVRRDGGKWSLDHIPSGLVLTKAKDCSVLHEIVACTKELVDWNDENAPFVIMEQKEIKAYFTRLKQAAEEGKPLPQPEATLKLKMGFHSEEKEESRTEAFDRAMKRLYGMIGLEQIKEEIEHFMESLKGERKIREAGGVHLRKRALHMLFVGPPGSGKTEVARIIGDLLYALGLIRENKCIEVGRKDLVSEYVGETEKKTEAVIQKAMGGLLFVDEAYTLKSADARDYGRQALEEIMRAMENHREDLVVVFAGYESRMEELLDLNEGLRSRFPYTFHFRDYTPKQVAEIGIRMLASQGYLCHGIYAAFEAAIRSRAKSGTIEGNARAARVITERIVQMHKVRIGRGEGSVNVREILPEDVQAALQESGRGKDAEGLRQIREGGFAKLERMIGLSGLKQEMRSWVNFIAVESKRAEQNEKLQKPTLHMTFEGNPGTGKTTVAKIIGEILKGSGVLSNGHYKEVSRSDLVGQYQGQTAERVKKVVSEAKGGILFIDEAYDLVNGAQDVFGKEAVNTLILEMENNREDLVVILAGYTREMEGLLASNPGFESRIARRFQFEDYSAAELAELALLQFEERGLHLDDEAFDELKGRIEEHVAENGGHADGNGRWVRMKVCDRIAVAQANRLMESGLNADLMRIRKEDITAALS